MAIYVSGHEAVCSGADARILTWSGVFQPFAIGNLSANHIRMNVVPVCPGCHAPLCFCEVALRARRTIPLVRDPGIKPGYDIDAHGKSASRIIRAPASVICDAGRLSGCQMRKECRLKNGWRGPPESNRRRVGNGYPA